jgi:hypothetical protein
MKRATTPGPGALPAGGGGEHSVMAPLRIVKLGDATGIPLSSGSTQCQ